MNLTKSKELRKLSSNTERGDGARRVSSQPCQVENSGTSQRPCRPRPAVPRSRARRLRFFGDEALAVERKEIAVARTIEERFDLVRYGILRIAELNATPCVRTDRLECDWNLGAILVDSLEKVDDPDRLVRRRRPCVDHIVQDDELARRRIQRVKR